MLDAYDTAQLEQLRTVADRFEFQAKIIRHAIEVCTQDQSTEGLSKMVAYAFNAQQYQPQYGGGGGLPAGPNGERVKYKVVIDASSQEPTKTGGGQLVFSLKCIEGPFTGQTQRDGLNLHNNGPKAAQTIEIANKQLSAYCHVIGKHSFQQTEELHNIPFIVEIGPQKGEPNFTEVVGLYDINGNAPGKAGSGSPQGQVSAPSAPPPGFGATGQQPQFGGGQPQQDPNQGQQQGGGQWGNQGGGAPQGQQAGQWGNQGGGQPQGDPNAGQQQQGGQWGGNQGQPQQQAPAANGWGNQGGGAPAGGGGAWGGPGR